MPWININGSRIIFLLAFILFVPSCQKDQVSTNGTTEKTPTILKPVVKESNQLIDETLASSFTTKNLISEKEVREVIQLKELLRSLIKESLIQLLLNHDFNPLMPQIDTRVACTTCTSSPTNDCGCPFQDPSTNPNPTAYPKTISLKYYNDVADCTCNMINPTSVGLPVMGTMNIEFSAPFTTSFHTIKLYPQNDFTVDGYEIRGTEIELTQFGNLDTYRITNIDNISVTKNGDVTLATGISNKSRVTVTDINNNRSDIANAFGLLDDIFTMYIEDLVIVCSNGESVLANSSEDLVYDMACDNIQDGIIVLNETLPGPFPGTYLAGDFVAEYDYGAAAPGDPEGECDDVIEVTLPVPGD